MPTMWAQRFNKAHASMQRGQFREIGSRLSRQALRPHAADGLRLASDDHLPPILVSGCFRLLWRPSDVALVSAGMGSFRAEAEHRGDA